MRSRGVRVVAASIFAVYFSGLLWGWASAADIQPTNQFAQELSQRGLVFDASVFSNFTVVRVLPNPQFDYSFAVRHRTLPLEVRFATRGLSTSGKIGPDSLRGQFVEASIMNMARKETSGPVMVEPKPFPQDAVKKEFNADWGATAMIAPDPTFAKYQSGLVSVIYQSKSGSLGYMIYLYNGDWSPDIERAVGGVFYAIHFK